MILTPGLNAELNAERTLLNAELNAKILGKAELNAELNARFLLNAELNAERPKTLNDSYSANNLFQNVEKSTNVQAIKSATI